LPTFTCDPSACQVPTGVANAATAVCGYLGSGVTTIADSASCTVACATGYTASTATAACSLGDLTTFTCIPNGRLLEESKAVDRRHLQAATTNVSNVTAMAATTTVDAEECVCETTPEVVTTFNSTLSFTNFSELAALNFSAIKASVANTFAGATTVAVAVVKVGVSYTFADGLTVSVDQCKRVVKAAYDVFHEDNVTVTQVPASARRLGERRLAASRMDVVISYAEADQAQAAAAVEASNSTAGRASFSTALIAETGIDAAAAELVAGSVTAPTVEVEIVFEVTGEAAITPPAASVMQTIMSTNGATVTAVVSAAEFDFTFMPCSAAPSQCTAGHTMRPSAESIGCAGAACVAADHDTCCLEQPSGQAGDARRACVLGSLTVLALLGNFLFA